MAVMGLWTGCASSAKPVPKDSEGPAVVWPLPPDPPRVRYVETISSDLDVKGKTKRSVKDIMLGIEPDRVAIHLGRPAAVVVDSKGRALVTDDGNPGIHVYDIPHRTFALYGTEGEGSLPWPMGIAVDGEDNIYVSDHKRSTVYKFSPAGKFLSKVGEFENPVGVAVDKTRGLLFVVDSQKHHVQVFTMDGKLKQTIGERGSDEGQFNYPTYCAVDNGGSLYVVDTGNTRVQVFDRNFEVVGSFGTNGTAPGQFTRPKGIAVDRHGLIYVTDAAFNNFQIFDPEFRLLLAAGEAGADRGQFRLPSGIFVDNNDRIYVADYGNGRLQILQLLSASVPKENPAAPAQ